MARVGSKVLYRWTDSDGKEYTNPGFITDVLGHESGEQWYNVFVLPSERSQRNGLIQTPGDIKRAKLGDKSSDIEIIAE